MNIRKLKDEKQRLAWKKMAVVWKRYICPPSRPCRSQIKNWKKIIKKEIKIKPDSKALILGATPELRDLALDLGFRTVCVDQNPVMISAMTSLMRHKNSFKEEKKARNWLLMNFPKSYFDVILEDAAFNQIFSKSDFNKLLVKLKNILKPEGIIFVREVVHLNKTPVIRKEKDWILWFNKYKKGIINELDLYSMLKYQSNINPFDSPSLADVMPLFYKLESLNLKSRVPKRFYYYLIKAFGKPPVSKFISIFRKGDLEKILSKNFKVISLKYCHEHYHCQYMPQYLLKPKKFNPTPNKNS